ncbi:hypothetical protein RB620_21860 [Paenibacillus sp. LHD-117]|uniref:hypothetical protein n=1 Tax=Paenibacillus sp. LHD-117 TaxID=3071412 RepID=UPI0027DF1C3D|nr:hypothetical protein [Paenibacillus sp. LHD-117]MDQ6422080.1 hypothetical protein [Paenibacillus sp. LHD-117]
MSQGSSVEEVMDFINLALRLPEGDETFDEELNGIRTELERLKESKVQFHTCHIDSGNFWTVVNQRIEISLLLMEAEEKTAVPVYGFDWVLKVFKSRYEIEDESDRFKLTFDGETVELERLDENRIRIASNKDKVEIIAGSFENYLDGREPFEKEFYYEHYGWFVPSRVTLVESVSLDADAKQPFLAVIRLLLTYFHVIAIRCSDVSPQIQAWLEELAYLKEVQIGDETLIVFQDPATM